MNIAKELNYEIKRQRISQTRISDITGLAQPTVSRVLRNPLRANVSTLVDIAEAAGCEIVIRKKVN